MDAQVVIPRPCADCQWFDACAHLNAICDAWTEAATRKPWGASQRAPRSGNVFFTEEQIVRALCDAQARYTEIQTERAGEPDPVISDDEDVEEAA